MKLVRKTTTITQSAKPIRTYLKLVSQRAMMPEYSSDHDRERNKAYYH